MFPGSGSHRWNTARNSKTAHRATTTILQRTLRLPQLFYPNSHGQPRKHCLYPVGVFGSQQRQLLASNDAENRKRRGTSLASRLIYSCRLTPWRVRQVGGNQRRELFNLELRRARVKVEHCMRRMKEYRAVSHLWRHERWMFPIVSKLCVFLAQRHINFSCVL